MCNVWHKFISQHTTQGNDRPSGSEDRMFTWFIHFCRSFYEELRRNHQRPWGADWKHTSSSWLPCPGKQAKQKSFSTAWESFHGHCRSSLQHADKSVVSDTDKSWCSLWSRVMRPQTSDTGVTTWFVAACHCKYDDEYETEYSGSIDSGTPPSIDIDIHLPIDNMSRESIDINPANETFTLPSHCYPRFDVATQPQTAIDYHYSDTISRQKNYSFGSWAEESFHESFAVNTELPETRYDEYDEDYHKEKNIECHGLAMGDRGLLHTSSADVTSTSIDSKPTPSIDVKTQNHRGAKATPFALTYWSGICLSLHPPTINSSNNPSIFIHYKHLFKEHLNNNNDYDLNPDEFGFFFQRFSRTSTRNGW